MINEKIKEILRDFNIAEKDGVPYLIALYYGYAPDYIPDYLKIKINHTKIVESTKTGLQWNLPLFDGVETAFSWVKDEYIALFARIGKGTNVRESTSRMKSLFAKNPEIRKEDVIAATEMYLLDTDPRFVRKPHYFIQKGVGGAKTEDILDWIDKYKESLQISSDLSSNLR